MRIIQNTYINADETLRIRIEHDSDAEHPRRGGVDNAAHLVAEHSRYKLADEDAISDLRDALEAILPEGMSTDEQYIKCTVCNNHDAYDEDGKLTLEESNTDWRSCWTCHGTGVLETHKRPGENHHPTESYLGKKAEGTWNIRCSTCQPIVTHGKPGQIPVCRTCQGDGDIENPHYLDDDSPLAMFEALKAIDPDQEHIFWLPVYMYEHSGIALSTKPFSCPWDSGQIGFIWVTKEAVIEIVEANQELALDALRQAGYRYLEGEIETYSQFLGDEIYGFICERYVGEEGEDKDLGNEGNWEEEDSCWGFYGMDIIENGMTEHWSDKYLDAFCEAEGITREQLKEEQEAFARKVRGKAA